MGKLIRMFLVNGSTDGLKTLEISNMTIKATVFPRPLLKDFLERDEAGRPGVYMLYGSRIDENLKSMLYIGEGDPVSERLKNHAIKKDFWTEAFVFTSKDEYLTKTQVKFLESRLINLAEEAKRAELDNVQSSNEPTISEVDRAEIQQFLEAIQLLVHSLRLNFFERLSFTSTSPTSTVDEIIYEYKVKDAIGKMAVRDGKYVLLSGSTAVKGYRDSASPNIRKYREELIADGALKYNDSTKLYDVIKDVPSNSSTYAGIIVCGGNTPGPTVWKYNSKTLREIESASQ
ncbi:MAG: GIY-YIG nuclease family protein [Oscillospiraceae bacterium]|nr:GIY-YIG nuclease family protein [Oscillospiraceae bacterium]